MSTNAAGLIPVVLLHGWGGSYADTWQGSPLERALNAARRPLVRVDLPGHGHDPASHEASDYVNIAQQLDEKLSPSAQLDGIGFSLGGKLLLELASQRPERFRRLVIGGVGANIFHREAGEAVAAALLNGVAPDAPAALRSVVEAARESINDPLALAAVIRRPSHPISPDALGAVRAEVLLVVGGADGIAGAWEPLARALRCPRSVIVDGLDHVSTPSSNEFATAAANFILAGDPPATSPTDQD
jgi:pimeloyl-ACP methyl ester carboxylesterase